MELIEKNDNQAVYMMESHYYEHEYVVRDMSKLSDGKANWKLTRYEKRGLGDKKVSFVMLGIVGLDGNYVEITMSVSYLSRRIRLNPEGKVVCDYIVDEFPNPLSPTLFTAFGNHYDYSMKNVGLPIMEYLQTEQQFVNDNDKDDVYVNRWLTNEFFCDFLLHADHLSKKTEDLYESGPKQLRLIPEKND